MKLTDDFLAAAEERLPYAEAVATRERGPRVARAVIAAAPVPAPVPEEAFVAAVPADGNGNGLAHAGIPLGEVEERQVGTDDLVDEVFVERALAACSPVCRIVLEVHGATEFATGFLVAPGVLMTNEHVLPDADAAGAARAELDVRVDATGSVHPGVRFALRPERFFAADAALDVALVAVDASSADGQRLDGFGYHRLIPHARKIAEGDAITLIQHPRGEPRKVALRENRLIGFLDDDRILYTSDTASGSSGSPCFSDDFQVVALHRAGTARRTADGTGFVLLDGRVVTSLDGIDETEVDWYANEGVRISAICRWIAGLAGASAELAGLRAAMDGDGDVMSRLRRGRSAGPTPAPTEAAVATTSATTTSDGATWTIPLQIHVSLPGIANGAPPAISGPAPAADTAVLEKMVVPTIDTHYENRAGYDRDFLPVRISLPTLTAAGRAAAATVDGSHTIRYEHFSLVLHKERRIAILTAANVDWTEEMRTPAMTRRELTGLAEGNIEKWATDRRVQGEWQLPDVFYTKDRQSFDKGHIVRRDDVTWGSTKAERIRANGDSFHVTNCSPQRKQFNQSAQGVDNWGDLENLVEHGVTRCCVLGGPIFRDDDPEFEGKDDVGDTTVQIPRSFWKIVVECPTDTTLQAYGFVLEQDLSDVQLTELAVPARWKKAQVSLADLQADLPLFTIPKKLVAADVLG